MPFVEGCGDGRGTAELQLRLLKRESPKLGGNLGCASTAIVRGGDGEPSACVGQEQRGE